VTVSVDESTCTAPPSLALRPLTVQSTSSTVLADSAYTAPPSAYAESNYTKTTVSSLTVPDCTLKLPPHTELGPVNGSIVA